MLHKLKSLRAVNHLKPMLHELKFQKSENHLKLTLHDLKGVGECMLDFQISKPLQMLQLFQR